MQNEESKGLSDILDADTAERLFSAFGSDSLWAKSLINVSKSGRSRYETPEKLLLAVCGYFQWVEQNPLLEGKMAFYEGNGTEYEVPHMRALTKDGLCLYLGIHRDTWGSWRRGDDRKVLQPVVEWAEQYMYDQKFAGGAAGLLNPALVARDLGLVDRSQVDTKTKVVIQGDEAEL